MSTDSMFWALVVVTISIIIFFFSTILDVRRRAKYPLKHAPLKLALSNIGTLFTVLGYAQFFGEGIFAAGGIARSTWTAFYIVYSALLPAGFAKEWVRSTKAVLLTLCGNLCMMYSFALSIIGFDICEQYGNILLLVLGIVMTLLGLLWQWKKA